MEAKAGIATESESPLGLLEVVSANQYRDMLQGWYEESSSCHQCHYPTTFAVAVQQRKDFIFLPIQCPSDLVLNLRRTKLMTATFLLWSSVLGGDHI